MRWSKLGSKVNGDPLSALNPQQLSNREIKSCGDPSADWKSLETWSWVWGDAVQGGVRVLQRAPKERRSQNGFPRSQWAYTVWLYSVLELTYRESHKLVVVLPIPCWWIAWFSITSITFLLLLSSKFARSSKPCLPWQEPFCAPNCVCTLILCEQQSRRLLKARLHRRGPAPTLRGQLTDPGERRTRFVAGLYTRFPVCTKEKSNPALWVHL